jgi:methionyl-tRNA formyltransferase
MGTPEFARRALEALTGWDGCEVVAVYCQPDRPSGRGQAVRHGEVKAFALSHGLPGFQPVNFREQATVDELAALAPEVLVVAAYGLILPQRVLDIPPLGALNIHASLLPKYRGAAPIQRAILDGEAVTGITIMRMDAGMDTGDILLARSLGIDIDETASEVHDQLADLGGRLIVDALGRLRAGRLVRIPQDTALATYAPKLEKDEGRLDFSRPAREVHNRARAMHPWPGAFCHWTGPRGGEPLRLVLTPGCVGPELAEPRPAPGTILGLREGLLAFACADCEYLVPSLKPAGKKLQSAEEFARGYLPGAARLA